MHRPASATAAATVTALRVLPLLAVVGLMDSATASDRWSAELGLDVTNNYMFRGIAQQDRGIIAQPWAEFALDLSGEDGPPISVFGGIWNSVHSERGGSTSVDNDVEHWYEADVYAGASVGFGKLEASLIYTAYMSPSDSFTTIDELMLGLSYDDSESPLLLGIAWSPSVTLAIEIGDGAASGPDEGIFLGFGVEPGFDLEDGMFAGTTISFPVQVGLGLADYYQDATGDDDLFGYVDVGVAASVPLSSGDSEWGAWTLGASVNALFLGSATEEINGGDNFEVIATVGISVGF